MGEFVRPASRGRAKRVVAASGSMVLVGGLLAACSSSDTEDAASDIDPFDTSLAVNDFNAQPASVTDSCFWGEPMGPVNAPVSLYAPDSNVTYWFPSFTLPAGAEVVLNGEFPHSRFYGLSSYATVSGQVGTPVGGFQDFEIQPDEGSVNPFIDGADRDSENRKFTLTLSGEVDPGEGQRVPNTFYVGQEGQTDKDQAIDLWQRVYRADEGRDMSGGVDVPTVSLKLADGTVMNEADTCATIKPYREMVRSGLTNEQYLALLNAPGAAETHPAVNPANWRKFFNTKQTLAAYLEGTEQEALAASLPTESQIGLYATQSNEYMSSELDRRLGPAPDGHNIAVIKAKMPTSPRTFAGDSTMDATTQVRYWSMCNNNSPITDPPLGQVVSDCLFDEQVPLDADGRYTIVASLAEDRPTNATAKCGVAWLDWTTEGDGVEGGNAYMAILIMRNQLASPDFQQAIGQVKAPGEEQATMGDYYPQTTYMSQADFEAEGCASPTS